MDGIERSEINARGITGITNKARYAPQMVMVGMVAMPEGTSLQLHRPIRILFTNPRIALQQAGYVFVVGEGVIVGAEDSAVFGAHKLQAHVGEVGGG